MGEKLLLLLWGASVSESMPSMSSMSKPSLSMMSTGAARLSYAPLLESRAGARLSLLLRRERRVRWGQSRERSGEFSRAAYSGQCSSQRVWNGEVWQGERRVKTRNCRSNARYERAKTRCERPKRQRSAQNRYELAKMRYGLLKTRSSRANRASSPFCVARSSFCTVPASCAERRAQNALFAGESRRGWLATRYSKARCAE